MNEMLGSKLGEGGCAEVYEWEDGSKVVKLAKPNTDAYLLQRELRNTRIAWESGLPVPRPYEYIEVDGRPGAIFERIEGQSMLQGLLGMLMQRNRQETKVGQPPLYHEVIAMTVQLMHRIHVLPGAELPSQKDYITYRIRNQEHLDDEEKEAVIELLERLSCKRQMCHGDFNPGNIMIRSNGEQTIIDWNDAVCGSPEADLADFIINIRYGMLPPELGIPAGALDAIREPFIERFIEEYSRISGITYSDVEPWIAIIAARKLNSNGISNAERQLLKAEIRRRIAFKR
ncbi:aminoglycoside phosphotransferase family protein [Paenibacillus xylaniclasticus]|uniref:aminoglycoside phosphotransferase family protein n=1 Tax=Paenibacillus xylaniclasticus TaxID=588083 RepID=UPI000FD6DE5E|nr:MULTISPECIES: aminoglycoside phosphotransferase family protein [Paenibacillus]GFN31162.1 aminoglycoside phosphotransferase [Paenibacillus curdlanolyticus]